MRHQIDKTTYEAIYNGDLAEAFETFIRQTQYLEVLCCNGRDEQEFIGALATFEPGRFYNTSAWFAPIDMPVSDKHPNGYTYENRIAEEQGHITYTYFRYDTLADAITHATALLCGMDREFSI